jgi:hypothetical protein
MKNTLRKLIPLIFLAVISLAVVLPSAVFVAPQPVYAAVAPASASPATINNSTTKAQTTTNNVLTDWIGNSVLQAVGAVVQILISVLGTLTVSLIHILLMVASYNDYMISPAITTGWVIVRDVANLFFVAIILIVSIGSIVNPERFGGVKKVFRVLLYALLVNFSRTIAGIFIDISQLIMLTFVNGFAQAAGGNFVEALGITKITDITAGTTGISYYSMMGQLLLGLFMFVIITVVIGIIVVALVVRMVTLWMLVVLSPLAFALGSSDITHQHYAEWWKKFSAELTTGPIVAFFLWLSLVTFQSSEGSKIVGTNGLVDGAKGAEPVTVDCGQGGMCQQENLVRFIVATAMLLLGLSFAREFSGLGKTLADAATSKGKQYASAAGRWASKRAALPAATVLTGGVAGGVVAGGIALASRSTYGQQLGNRVRGFAGKTMGGGNAVGNVVGKIPILGGIGRGLTVSAGKKREEMLKDAREKTKGLNEAQRAALFTSRVQPQIVKDAIALDIVKDRVYSNARVDDKDPVKAAKAKDFETAVMMLDNAGKNGDKDSADKIKDIKDVRPDIGAILSADKNADGSVNEEKVLAKINANGAEADIEKLKKVDFDAMSERRRNEFFKGMRPDLLQGFYEKGSSSKEKGYIEEYRRQGPPSGPLLTGEDLRNGIRGGSLNIETAPGTVRQADGVMQPNIELAVETVNVGNAAQIRQLQDKADAGRIRKAIEDGLREHVDFNTGAGLENGQKDSAMTQDNLRHAETAVILGGDAADLYKIKSDGSFAGDGAKDSFGRSVRTSPQRMDFIINMKANDIKGDVAKAISESLSVDDLDALSRRARTGDETATVASIVKDAFTRAEAAYTDPANKNTAGAKEAKDRINRISANPNLNQFV